MTAVWNACTLCQKKLCCTSSSDRFLTLHTATPLQEAAEAAGTADRLSFALGSKTKSAIILPAAFV